MENLPAYMKRMNADKRENLCWKSVFSKSLHDSRSS